MISRYLLSGQTKYIPSNIGSNTPSGSTGTTQTYTTVYAGEPGAVLGLKVTSYTHSSGGALYTFNGTTYVLNDTFNITLDGAGQFTATQVVDVGTSSPGNGIDVIVTIMSTTIGAVGTPNSTNISKTI
jgi:hypothetical protein